MNVSVAYAEANQQVWLKLEVAEETTVQTAIEESGVLDKFPHIDLTRQKVGIFGKMTKLDTVIKEGDRVEIYRVITVDPKTVPRRQASE